MPQSVGNCQGALALNLLLVFEKRLWLTLEWLHNVIGMARNALDSSAMVTINMPDVLTFLPPGS